MRRNLDPSPPNKKKPEPSSPSNGGMGVWVALGSPLAPLGRTHFVLAKTNWKHVLCIPTVPLSGARQVPPVGSPPGARSSSEIPVASNQLIREPGGCPPTYLACREKARHGARRKRRVHSVRQWHPPKSVYVERRPPLRRHARKGHSKIRTLGDSG